MTLEIGQILKERYRIESVLGEGGMGTVYSAYDTLLERPRAIKELPPDPLASEAKLLAALDGTPEGARTARFCCAVALVRPARAGGGAAWQTEVAEGMCEGRIAFVPSGSGGFGYDPLFYVPEYGCTMAELPAEIKNRISHRARAVQAARPFLDALLGHDNE